MISLGIPANFGSTALWKTITIFYKRDTVNTLILDLRRVLQLSAIFFYKEAASWKCELAIGSQTGLQEDVTSIQLSCQKATSVQQLRAPVSRKTILKLTCADLR